MDEHNWICEPCACGCGEVVYCRPLSPAELRKRGPKRYIRGHQSKGKRLTPAHRAKAARHMEDNGRWRGGKFVDPDGYVLVKRWDHPYHRKGGYVLEHRLVMETQLGRYLESDEIVHHINGNAQDNRVENLELMHQDRHATITRQGRKFPSKKGLTGDWYTCEVCGNKFYRSPGYRKRQNNRWCSWGCRYGKPRPRKKSG